MSVFSMNSAPRPIGRGLRFPARMKLFIKTHIADQAIDTITWIVGLFAVGIGISLVAAPPALHDTPPFSLNFQVAPPHIWGFGFFLLGAWIAVALLFQSANPKLPCYFVGVLSGAWGCLSVADAFLGNAFATAFVAYVALGAVAFVTGIAHEDFDDMEWS